jgi:Flp pilus assembly protein TadD
MAGETEPTTDDAYRGLGEAYQNLGNLAEAEKTYRRAIALRPNYWAPYNWMGVFYFHEARFADAAAMFNKVTALVPDSFRGYSNLGAALNGEGRYRDAIEANHTAHGLCLHEPRQRLFLPAAVSRGSPRPAAGGEVQRTRLSALVQLG